MGPVDAGQIGTMGSGVPIGMTGLAGEENAIGNIAGDQSFPGLGSSWPGDRIATADEGVAAPARHHGADNVAPDAGAEGPDELGDRQIDQSASTSAGDKTIER